MADGVETKIPISLFMRNLAFSMFQRNLSPIRNLTTFFDRSYVSKFEKEIQRNILEMRAFIKDLIDVKRQQISTGTTKKGDFLSIMIEDELYS